MFKKEFISGECGLIEETKGKFARTTNGILGTIINPNSEQLINGPEIMTSGNKIYCVDRDSIITIEDNLEHTLYYGDELIIAVEEDIKEDEKLDEELTEVVKYLGLWKVKEYNNEIKLAIKDDKGELENIDVEDIRGVRTREQLDSITYYIQIK